MKNKKILRLLTFLISLGVLTGLDQYTKYLAELKLKGNAPVEIIKGVFELFYLQNIGAAWGIFSGKGPVLIIFTIFILIILAYIIAKIPYKKKYNAFFYVLILMYAGALGNLLDRITKHYVIDFFYFKLINFPVFNVSDIYVTFSMVLLILLVFFVYKEADFEFLSRKKKRKDLEDAED